MNPLKTALGNKKMKWKVISKRPALFVFPGSMICCQQSRVLLHNKDSQCTYNGALGGVCAAVIFVVGRR